MPENNSIQPVEAAKSNTELHNDISHNKNDGFLLSQDKRRPMQIGDVTYRGYPLRRRWKNYHRAIHLLYLQHWVGSARAAQAERGDVAGHLAGATDCNPCPNQYHEIYPNLRPVQWNAPDAPANTS